MTPPGASTSSKQLKELVQRRHPQFECHLTHWAFLEATYDGGREWFNENIFRYIKEGDSEFKDRVNRAYRFNHTREVVDLINKYLFKQNIVRNDEDAPESVKKFWQRSTRNGMGISDFSRQISKKTSIYGRVAIVVDRTTAEGEIVSKADEKAANLQTYAYIVPPEQVLDYSYDEQGALNWILLLEQVRDDADPLTSSGKVGVRYRLWTKTYWLLIEEKGKGKSKTWQITDSGTHDLGEVPVVLADHIVSDDLYVSPAMIDDIAYLDRAVANYLSNIDAIIQDQTFSQLAMPAQGVEPGTDSYDKMKEMGTKRIFLYDGGDSANKPFYLSPDVKQAQVIITTIKTIINEIYHTVGLAGERTKQDNALGIDNSSGVAKAYDFERVNALLAAKADSLEMTENKIVRLVCLWNGENMPDEEKELVTYPNNFDTRGLYDEFDLAARLMLVDAPDSVRREQMQSVLDKLFPQLSQAKRVEIEKELKDWPPQDVVDPLADPKSLPADAGQAAKQTNTDSAKNISKAV
ncbi:TPA: phage portal protein [Escherichia coli]|nr:phage portal protein [Escherichia coli]HCJ8610360.1 phage portal protein [Escherichia coli]